MLYNSQQKEFLGERKMKKTEIDIANIDYLFRTYGGNHNLVIGIDYLSESDSSADLVVYDVSDFPDVKEVDRVTLIETDK